MTYSILERVFNKEGINDGLLFEVVDNRFNTISFHKSRELAQKKINKILKGGLKE